MNEKLREAGGGGRLRKGHGLDSLQQQSFQDDSLSQAAAFPGLAGLLEMNGSPQPSQGMAANEPDSQLGASVCLGRLAALPASQASSAETHYAVCSHALCILMNESGDRLNLKEESLLSELGEGLSRDGLAAWILQEKERGMQSPFSKERERGERERVWGKKVKRK